MKKNAISCVPQLSAWIGLLLLGCKNPDSYQRKKRSFFYIFIVIQRSPGFLQFTSESPKLGRRINVQELFLISNLQHCPFKIITKLNDIHLAPLFIDTWIFHNKVGPLVGLFCSKNEWHSISLDFGFLDCGAENSWIVFFCWWKLLI